jgi:hypothetical protein
MQRNLAVDYSSGFSSILYSSVLYFEEKAGLAGPNVQSIRKT